MGFQNGNDNSNFDYNNKAQKKSNQKTSTVESFSKNTTKAQYQRLDINNSVDTRGVTAKHFNIPNPVVDNQADNQSSVGRTSNTKFVQKYQNYNNAEQFTKSGPMDVDE